jgi:hypothetical protein
MASAFEMPEDKRDTKRERLLLTAQMVFVDGTRDVHLLNISARGAKLDSGQPPMRDEAVTLICGGMRIAGRIAWVDETRFGVAFDLPIDPRDLIVRGRQHLAG